MKNTTTLIAFLFIAISINAQTSKFKFSKKQLSDNFDFLVTAIKNTHPNPHTVVSEKDFENKVKIIKENFNDSLTLKEFYRVIAPVVASIKDGHTKLVFPGRKLLDADDYLFPFAILRILKS